MIYNYICINIYSIRKKDSPFLFLLLSLCTDNGSGSVPKKQRPLVVLFHLHEGLLSSCLTHLPSCVEHAMDLEQQPTLTLKQFIWLVLWVQCKHKQTNQTASFL